MKQFLFMLGLLVVSVASQSSNTCEMGSFAKLGDAVVEFNPADESFDGTNTGYDLGTTTLNIATAGFTVVTRVKFAAFQHWSSIFDFSDSNGDTANNNIRVNNVASTGKWSFDIREGGTVACQIYNQGTIELNTWYNIIARYKPGEGISLRANDAVFSTTCTTISDRVSTRTYIGQSFHSGLANFKGEIAGLYAYERFLTNAEAEAVLSTITNTLTLHTDTGSHSWTEAETYAASQGGRLPTLDELRAYETKTGYFATRNINEWIPVTNPGAPSGADYMMAYNGHGFSLGDSRWEKMSSEGDPISSSFGQQEWTGVGQYPVWFSSDLACVQCPSGSTSPAGSISADSCECAADLYKHESSCLACPSGMLSPVGSTSSNACACAENSYKETDIQAEWPSVSFATYENEFPSGGNMDNYAFSLWNGVSAKLISGWTHTATYAHGFLRSGAGDSVLEVNGLVPGKEYLYATYNFHDPTHSTYAYSWGLNSFTLYVNGVQVASLSGQPTSSESTYAGQVTADSSGKILFKFTHTNEHLHLSGLSVEAVCQSCPPDTTSLPGSTSVSNCTSTCASGTYLFTIPEIEWQFRGGDSWGSLQQHEFVQAGIALGYQSRYLTKEEMTAWMSANGNSLPSTYQVWAWVSPGQSKTYGLWGIWTNAFHDWAGFEHDGTFAGSNDMPEGYFFRKNQPGTMCKTCSTGQVTANDGAIGVDACICAANSYATADEDMLTYTDSNFEVSSEQDLDENTVYYETTKNGFTLEFHHWSMKTVWGNGYALFSYEGVYNSESHNLAEVKITSLVPGAEYKINLFHYLQNGWQYVYWHEGEFMFSVNGGSLQRFDTVEMPSSGVPPPTTALTVAAKDDGTISLLFTRDMQIDAGGRFTSDCAVFNPPLRNCNTAGRHLVLSGLSIAPVCASCPGELTSPAGSTAISDCACAVNTFEKNPAFSLFRFNGDSNDEVGTASIHKIGGTAATFVSDPARGSVLNVNSMLYKIESMTLGSMLDSSAFTISAWMLFKDLTSDSLLLSRFDTSGGDDRGGFIFWVKSKKLVLQQYYGPSSTPYMIESNSELSATNQWYHIALVKKSDAEIQFFIDGNLDRSFTMSPAAKSMRSPISFIGLGAYCYTSTSSDTGYVCATATSYLDIANFYAQDLHFYDYALSEVEIGYLSAGDQLSCSLCPDGMTSLAGSTSISNCGCPSNSYGPHGPLDGLVGMFGLNGNTDDEIGTASIKMYSGTATFVQDADRGQVLDNSATKMYIESTALSNALDQDAWSVSLWFKPPATWDKYIHIANRYDITTGANGERGGFSFGVLNTGKIILQRQREGGNYWINCQGSTIITANTWYHVVAISEPRNLKVYLNGNVGTAECDLTSSTDWAHTQLDLPPKIGIGLYCVDNDSMENDCYVHHTATNDGYRQDLRFYNRALTSDEIVELAARTGQEGNVCASCPSGLTSPAFSTSISACACADNQQTVAFKNDKLQAWYKLESDGLDSGPHEAHLQTRLSATANFVSGQYLSVSDDVSFLIPREKTGLIIPAGTTALTVSFWVKNWIDGYVMRWVPSNLFFWENLDASKDGEASIEGSTLKTLFTKSSQWTHMLFVFDQTQIVFYENGVFKDHSTAAKIPAGGFVQEADKDAGFFCNPYAASNAHDFRGDIKDIRFYLTAFTSAEAQALYAGVSGCVTADTGVACPAGSSLPSGSSSLDACVCDANLHSDFSSIYDGRPPISAWSYSQLSSEAACNTPLHFGVHDGVDTSGAAGTGKTACFETVDSNNYLQLDMSTEVIVTGIQTMGRASDTEYVTLYQVQVSRDGATWTNAPCAEVDASGFCVGNVDAGSVKQNDLASKVVARYVKLIVKGYSGHESLRMSVLAQTCVSCPNVAWQHYVPA